MQLLATAAQMQGWDRTAIDKYGIAGLALMENAGRAFTDQLERVYGPLAQKRLVVLAGKGNNGGDGYVIARHVLNRGALVTVGLLARRKDIRGDALTNLEILRRIARSTRETLRLVNITTPGRLDELAGADIIVDAIFGTGFVGSAAGLARQAIEWTNQQPSFIASVDIASGVDASTGCVEGVAVQADLTITMAVGKVGQYVGVGRQASGEVDIVDIGIPRAVIKPPIGASYRVGAADVARALPQRSLSAHKYSVGKVFVLAGSRAFTGAPALASQGVLVSGAGAVILGLPRSIHPVLASRLREAIILPLDETAAGTVAQSAVNDIQQKIDWADVVVIGPGLGRDPDTDALLHRLILKIDKPCIIDADGLNALVGKTQLLGKRKAPTILTPHAGELSRLVGIGAAEIEAHRVEVARHSASDLHSIVVLKGASTVTASPDGGLVVNPTGNPGMATIGAGDVLTGVIAGLIAQGEDPFTAGWSGAFLHGRAGDLAAERFGQRSLVASDILEHVPMAIVETAKHGVRSNC
jgi:ADP-dependent NAD(P)H-hydrate dehydratase / NAD(P)H-hydrate epimerase